MSDPGHHQDESDSDEWLETDGSYVCDQCGEEIVIPLDPGGGTHQSYVEDCPVCCCPNLIHVDWDGGRALVRAEPEQDRF